MKRQRVRRAILIVSLLLFPVTLNYFSPYVSIDGAMAGIVSGSLILFALLFFSSIFFGRAWCGWLCPMSGLADISLIVSAKRPNVRRLRIVRYSIFAVWAGTVAAMFILAGGIRGVDPLHLTDSAISVDTPDRYIIYYSVLAVFIILTFTLGRRGACHSICWMAPFMSAGYSLGRILKLPQLRMKAVNSKCVGCGACDKKCPMSIDVSRALKTGSINTSECILCGECADVCNKKVIRCGLLRRRDKKK